MEIDAQREAEISAAQETKMINAVDHLDALTETERSAALLGVSAEEWKPIGFLNKGHYNTLIRGNALDGSLAQKLEAYKEVASGGSVAVGE